MSFFTRWLREKLPFRGASTGLITEAILNRDPVAPTQVNPDIPPSLQEVIQRALEKDRNLRYQHASDMRAELQRLKRDTESGRRTTGGASAQIRTPGRSSSTGNQSGRTESGRTAAARTPRVSKVIDSSPSCPSKMRVAILNTNTSVTALPGVL